MTPLASKHGSVRFFPADQARTSAGRPEPFDTIRLNQRQAVSIKGNQGDHRAIASFKRGTYRRSFSRNAVRFP